MTREAWWRTILGGPFGGWTGASLARPAAITVPERTAQKNLQ